MPLAAGGGGGNHPEMPSGLARLAGALGAAALLAAPAAPAVAGPPQCRVIDVDFTPSEKLQMVVWLEDTSGNYVDTLFITDGVGRRGLGNRPGRWDFNSGTKWPYGRRTATFPVWANRHGESFPLVVFQNERDSDLSHPFNQSSTEAFFCRPLRTTDQPAWDTGTCGSPIFTDKGKLDPVERSPYPPREDIAAVDGIDDPAVDAYDEMNPFDIVSQATPVADLPFTVSWPIPDDLPLGEYVLFMEVAKEFDHNETYTVEARPAPTGIAFSEFGLPYRGQPSVIYQVPVTVGTTMTSAATMEYAGYGDPDGMNGAINPPDVTITTNRPGSGAARLLVRMEGPGMFRLRATARPEEDSVPPGPATELQVPVIDPSSATVTFVAPADDSALDRVTGYEVRYRALEPITPENFLDSTPIAQSIAPDEPGQVQDFELTGLLPQTPYYVAVRAFDECRNYGPLVIARFETPARTSGEVDACFVATAAYGTLMANEVAPLRQFRDSVLRRSVLGELFVETYYSVGPAFATVVDQSDPLRQAARSGLRPFIDLVRGLRYEEE